MLAPGGRLVYSTCSILPGENEEVVTRLLAAEPQMAVAAMPEGPRSRPARSIARWACSCCREQRRDGRLLLCLSRKDNGRNLSSRQRSQIHHRSVVASHATRRSNKGWFDPGRAAHDGVRDGPCELGPGFRRQRVERGTRGAPASVTWTSGCFAAQRGSVTRWVRTSARAARLTPKPRPQLARPSRTPS